jgi:FAD:protein FMN transferase
MSGKMQLHRADFYAMGGQNEIAVAFDSEDGAKRAMELAAREVLRIQDKYSRYKSDDGSIVHRINSSAGTNGWVECDPETMFLLSVARDFHQRSDGLFDITSGVLRKVWDFKAEIVPTTEQLAGVLSLIGFDKIEFKSNTIRLPLRGMEVDFGGFGKEYAADRAAAVLRAQGMFTGFVNLGGDIAFLGPQPDGQPWSIGLANPRKEGELVGALSVDCGGLVTSGDAVKYFIKDGVRHSHLMNPRTGFSPNCWSSVSVLGANTLSAGFLSTTAMLLELRATEFLRGTGAKFLLINQSGEIVGS